MMDLFRSSGTLRRMAVRYSKPVGALGGVASLVAGIYSDQVRSGVVHVLRLMGTWGTAPVVAVVFAGVGWSLQELRWKLKSRRSLIRRQSFEIQVDDFENDLPRDQSVIGRELHYLEHVTESNKLVVLLHGLGLDANDFRPYMQVAKEHTVGITLFGFNESETSDARYRPIGLTTHAELVNGAINNLHRQYPGKKLVLVGFSLGADMLLRLGELWQDHPSRKPQVSAILLLDPNINHSTMLLSGGLARMNPLEPLTELKRIAQIPTNLVEFQNFSEYLHKVSVKNPAQIRRHAQDVWDYWEPDGKYDLFMDRIKRLAGFNINVRVICSVHYEQHFNDVTTLARGHGLRQIFSLCRVDHFALFREPFLIDQMKLLV